MNVVDQTVTELSNLASRTVKFSNAFYGRNDDCWVFLENQDWLASILVVYSDAHLDAMLEQLCSDSSLAVPNPNLDVREAVAAILVKRFKRKEAPC